MPITFSCPCGKTLRVPDEHAGKRVKCPACGAVGAVPSAEPKFEVVEDEPKEQLAARPVARPATRRADDEDDDEEPVKVVAKKSRCDDEDDDDSERDRPWKKKRENKARTNSAFGFEKRVFNGGAIGGLLAMVGAVVWFVVGLANDIIFFYPPVLFVIGLVAFFKGLTGRG